MILPDSTMLIAYMLEKFTWVIDGLRIDKRRMLENLERTGGLAYSQHVLLLLVEKGLTREAAYKIVQGAAMRSMSGSKSFKELLAADHAVKSRCKPQEIDRVFDLDAHLERVDFIFNRVLSKRGRPKKGDT
jgi:adenylosuccinate lyase